MKEELALLGGRKAVRRTKELARASRWPVFTKEEKNAVTSALSGANLYAETPKLEQEARDYFGTKHVLATNNGTSAIHSAYFAAGVGPGDEVITSAYTWHLQVSQILALHAIPVFCDIDPRSACIDPEDIERKISRRTKAIAVVHPMGAIAPMNEIMRIARKHGIPVVEDCSHAHGASYKGRKVGTIGDVGCFSLQAAKLLTAIEGGLMITNNEEYYERACLLGHYERIPQLKAAKYRRYYDPEKDEAPTCFGFKYRMHPLAAAIARIQLRRLDERNEVRARNMDKLATMLAAVGGEVFKPPCSAPGSKRAWFSACYCQYFADEAGVPRKRFIEALCAEGLPASGGRTGYLPIYWNPLYEKRAGMWGKGYPFDAPYVRRKITYERGICKEAETYWTRTVGLPVLHQPVSPELIGQMAHAVDKVLKNLGRLKETAR